MLWGSYAESINEAVAGPMPLSSVRHTIASCMLLSRDASPSDALAMTVLKALDEVFRTTSSEFEEASESNLGRNVPCFLNLSESGQSGQRFRGLRETRLQWHRASDAGGQCQKEEEYNFHFTSVTSSSLVINGDSIDSLGAPLSPLFAVS